MAFRVHLWPILRILAINPELSDADARTED